LWLTALGSRKFMGGETPNLAGALLEEASLNFMRLTMWPCSFLSDIAFFGVLRAVEGFDTHKDVLANTDLRPWCVYRRKARNALPIQIDRLATSHVRRYARMQGMVATSSRMQ
jgi:hypothetical protein